jgi:hypothetical protein
MSIIQHRYDEVGTVYLSIVMCTNALTLDRHVLGLLPCRGSEVQSVLVSGVGK